MPSCGGVAPRAERKNKRELDGGALAQLCPSARGVGSGVGRAELGPERRDSCDDPADFEPAGVGGAGGVAGVLGLPRRRGKLGVRRFSANGSSESRSEISERTSASSTPPSKEPV